jgi:hypothetical protein
MPTYTNRPKCSTVMRPEQYKHTNKNWTHNVIKHLFKFNIAYCNVTYQNYKNSMYLLLTVMSYKIYRKITRNI